jgi:vancomycin resistance protein YoaR
LKLKPNGADTKWVQDFVRKQVGDLRPAKVRFENGTILRDYEVAGYALDEEALLPKVLAAFQSDGMLDLPIKMAEKRIPDTELDKIREVVSEFSTRFPVGQRSRNANLNLASGKIDGLILMPGQSFSFNETLGERTMRDGYKVAPVIKNGKHDVGIGGGICQVSGTLYNAVVYANLKVLLRSNHSLPSAYLALGRDCTVSWPSLDFKFQNDSELPIAISRTYEPGKLTFRILGTKVVGQEVKLQTVGHRSWGRGLKYEHDSTLPFGKQKIIEKGSSGHAVTVYRIVMLNGKELRREVLNRSNYAGSPKIIALNKTAKPPAGALSPPSEPVEDEIEPPG